MKRRITQTRSFEKEVKDLISKNRLLEDDFEEFKGMLAGNPEEGDLIPGTGGVRKTRLKSASKGKSGGFRVCYFDDSANEEIFLMLIYPKNEQENLTPKEKKFLKELIEMIKGD